MFDNHMITEKKPWGTWFIISGTSEEEKQGNL